MDINKGYQLLQEEFLSDNPKIITGFLKKGLKVKIKGNFADYPSIWNHYSTLMHKFIGSYGTVELVHPKYGICIENFSIEGPDFESSYFFPFWSIQFKFKRRVG